MYIYICRGKGGAIIQFLKNQSLIVPNILCYRCTTQIENIWEIITYIEKYIETIGFTPKNKIITSIEYINDSRDIILDILIPIDSKFEDNEHFSFLSCFKLIHAIKVRHEGSINMLSETQKKLREHLIENSYEAITKYYNIIIRHDSAISANSIIDIYVGINPNIVA